MTIKTLSAIAILSTALVSPVLAQDAHVRKAADNGAVHHLRHFRGAYNQAPLNGPDTVAPTVRGFIGEGAQYDRSFPGGRDPDLNPPGN